MTCSYNYPSLNFFGSLNTSITFALLFSSSDICHCTRLFFDHTSSAMIILLLVMHFFCIGEVFVVIQNKVHTTICQKIVYATYDLSFCDILCCDSSTYLILFVFVIYFVFVCVCVFIAA